MKVTLSLLSAFFCLTTPLAATSQSLTAEEIVDRLVIQELGLSKGVEFYAEDTEPDGYRRLPVEDQIQLSIPFAFDSDKIEDASTGDLAELCKAMTEIKSARLQIIGHTDASGSVAYNNGLSERRANSVASYLIDECGVEAETLRAVGFGEKHLLDPSAPNDGRNRRVEVQTERPS